MGLVVDPLHASSSSPPVTDTRKKLHGSNVTLPSVRVWRAARGGYRTGVSTGRSAVVIGAGHNGLVAANLLADAGWQVLVLEAQDHAGGAVYSDSSLRDGFVTDWYSAFYPLTAASPVIRGLDLHEHGLRWAHAPHVLAHVFPDGRCAVLSRDPDRTAESVDRFGSGDGAAWLRTLAEYERIREPLLAALFTPFPPVRPALALARALGTADLIRFARFAVQSVRSFTNERFDGAGASMLFASNALHTDLSADTAGSAVFGWLLCMLGQTVGFPTPVGGTGKLTDALVSRLESRGGEVRTGIRVERIDVRAGRARGVHTADGEFVGADAVLADVAAPHLYGSLISPDHLPRRLMDDLENFEWDAPTLKINWALSHPIPWLADDARGAGTVHLGVDAGDLSFYSAALSAGRLPDPPLLLLGQMTTTDPLRSPPGTESVWAYTHLPKELAHDTEAIAVQVKRAEEIIERAAPGFGASVLARRVQHPADLAAADANLVGGAVNGGTAQIHQQLLFRPVPGLGRAETPIDGVYLASASAHPGGGVHGGPGANAATAALRRAGRTGAARRRVIDLAQRRIYG